ncbi:MAG: DNA polymerase/3'-5' exonuclease PolX [Thermoleophilaceae bacterium]|nr:DNA polymerase/3'-5' exonuclease PolX [Thermoleophilaceae bacterium]
MRNTEIADAFSELADLYELDGAIVHRVLAYRNGAKAIRDSGRSVAELSRAGRVEELSGVGKTLAEKIEVLLETGSIPSAEKLKAKFPAGLVAITRIPGLGPKRVRRLHDELGISSLEELGEAAAAGRLRDLSGFGAKAEQNILESLVAFEAGAPRGRVILSRALAIANELRDELRAHPSAIRVEVAGSARRMAESCKDLDIVAATTDRDALIEAFLASPLLEGGSSGGSSGARATTNTGMPVDLRIVAPDCFGNLLQHFTGSKQHNEALRTAAVKRGLHVSEYGIKDDATGETATATTEAEVYELLGMAYVEPELRENRGELEAARKGRLPQLIEPADIRGDLHMHTTASDGRNSIGEMAQAAIEQGLDYIAITDHSASHGFGNEVSPDALRRLIARVREVDERIDGIRILAGSEVNVLPNGSLDYDDQLLGELDWVIASLHSSFRMGEREITDRMVRAIEHPLVDAIGHPTGRLIERREPYAVDFERVIAAAVGTGTFLEINANPDRRDLNEIHARQAVEAGVKLVIDSDAHGVERLANIRYGIATARRAWLTAGDVANTRSWPELRALRPRPT